MPSAANIVLNDNLAAAHTFKPIGKVGTSGYLLETSEMLIGAAEKQLILELNRQSAKRLTDRITLRLAIPYEATADGVTTVRSTARVIIEVIMPADCTATERGHIGAFAKNLLANSVVQNMMALRESMY